MVGITVLVNLGNPVLIGIELLGIETLVVNEEGRFGARFQQFLQAPVELDSVHFFGDEIAQGGGIGLVVHVQGFGLVKLLAVQVGKGDQVHAAGKAAHHAQDGHGHANAAVHFRKAQFFGARGELIQVDIGRSLLVTHAAQGLFRQEHTQAVVADVRDFLRLQTHDSVLCVQDGLDEVFVLHVKEAALQVHLHRVGRPEEIVAVLVIIRVAAVMILQGLGRIAQGLLQPFKGGAVVLVLDVNPFDKRVVHLEIQVVETSVGKSDGQESRYQNGREQPYVGVMSAQDDFSFTADKQPQIVGYVQLHCLCRRYCSNADVS